MVVVIKKPDTRVSVILLEWHCVAVGDVNDTTRAAAEEYADDALARVLSDAVVMVDDARLDEWVNDHFLDGSC